MGINFLAKMQTKLVLLPISSLPVSRKRMSVNWLTATVITLREPQSKAACLFTSASQRVKRKLLVLKPSECTITYKHTWIIYLVEYKHITNLDNNQCKTIQQYTLIIQLS
jgi:hypothetical protein